MCLLRIFTSPTTTNNMLKQILLQIRCTILKYFFCHILTWLINFFYFIEMGLQIIFPVKALIFRTMYALLEYPT